MRQGNRRESAPGPCAHFSLGPRKPCPILVPSLRDNWLTWLSHQCSGAIFAKIEQGHAAMIPPGKTTAPEL